MNAPSMSHLNNHTGGKLAFMADVSMVVVFEFVVFLGSSSSTFSSHCCRECLMMMEE